MLERWLCVHCGVAWGLVEGARAGGRRARPVERRFGMCTACKKLFGFKERVFRCTEWAGEFGRIAKGLGWEVGYVFSVRGAATTVELAGSGRRLRVRFAATKVAPWHDWEHDAPDFEVRTETNQQANGGLAAAVEWLNGFGRVA